MRRIFVIAGMFAIASVPAQSRAQSSEVPLQVSLCEIKAHPENFVHKLVEFTATASHGFEDSMVEDSHCSWPDNGPGIWMEYGGKRSTATMYAGGGTPKPDRPETLVVDEMTMGVVDDENFQEFDKRLHPSHPKKRSSDTVKATLRGRIFAKYEGIMGTQQNPEWRGYGHMDCCILFVVTQVVAIDPARP